ncbi:MAG: hypothetical protein UT89_C0009G0005 [Parcubacteria group bacterium GW2011_GWE1_40_20]|nr:MAG: hypothetical protein UT89_C0009G0005 [Parcubacteria group bacterium GW2011_GWE1_40_20]
MKDQELLDQISKKLSALIAISFSPDTKKMTTSDGERMLRRFGLNNQEIADILGTTRRTIEVMKSRNRKNKKN